MRFFFILVVSLLSTISVSAEKYQGPLVDAHSQVRCDVHPSKIINLIEKRNIQHVILSMGGCTKGEMFYGKRREQRDRMIKEIKKSSKVSLMTGIKGARDVRNEINFGKKNNSVGVSELIVQHAPWNDKKLVFGGVNKKLTDSSITNIINEIIENSSPVIIHIELNDSEDESRETLMDLRSILDSYPKHPFILIHMGQASPSEVDELISNHRNIYFLTSMTSGFFQIARKKKKLKAQTGWISFFETDSNNIKQHKENIVWIKEWQGLVEKYPDRFILAFDNLFFNHHKNRMRALTTIWRNAFGQIDKEVANKVACINAKEMWSLPVTCN